MAKLISIAPLKSAPLLKRPSTHHATTRNFKKKVFTRVGSAQRRQKSGNESTHETSPQKAFDVFTRENHSAAEVIAERSMLQATESRMKGTSRDKESLLDECLALKNALANQRYHLQLHKVHHELVNVEQRKIEIQMGELEVAHGLKAPRTGDLSQLKARYLGLKCRQQEYFTTLTTLQDDLDVLKKDPRVSFTQEAMAQRDIFASETRRLQKIIHKLQICHLRVVEENNKVAHLCENIAKLTCKINSIEKSMKDKKSTIEQMRKDIDKAKTDAIEAQNNTKNAVQKTGELENHSHVLQTMLIREKEEASRIQKQTSMMNEQIRIIRKNNSDRALQAQIAAGMDLAPSVGKGGRKARKVAKLKDQSESDDTSPSSPAKKDLTSVRSSPSSPATPSCPNVGKDFDEIRANYFRAIGSGTNTFVEGAPRSGSPKAKIHPDLGSPSGDHSNYEQLQTSFVIDVTKAEDEFTAMMEKFEYGATRPKRDLEAEAASLRGELEALKKSQVDVKKWLENLTIELDDQTLKANEYIVDVKDTKTNVRITSPDKTPEALARKKTEEEARRKKAAEDAERRVAEEATRRAAEEVTRRAAEEATRRAVEETTRRLAEEAARRAAEEAARRAPKEAATRAAEEITRRLAEEAARRAAEEPARRAVGETTRRFAEEAARRATEEAARRAAEEATTRAVEETTRGFAEEAARQAAEEAAKRTAEEAAKRTAEEATTRAVEETTRRLAKEAARRAAEEAARRATEEAATQADEETTRRLAEKAARQVAEEAQRKTAEDEEAARRIAEEKRRATEATKRKKEAEDEAARKRAAEETAGKSTSSTPSPKGKEPAAEEFFDEKMQGTIKENIKDVLKHLETISETVQQKATTGGTAEQSAKDALKKFD